MKNKVINFFKALGLIFIYLLLSEVTAIIASPFKDNKIVCDIVLLLGNIITATILIFLSRKKLIGKWDEFKKNKDKNIPIIFKYWITGFTIMMISNLIIVFLFLKGIAPNEEANREMLRNYPLYMIFAVTILAPICEELMFRFSFKNVFKNRLVYILFTGISFGAMHLLANTSLIELLYIIPYSALGIAFSAICYDTDNIYSSIIAHIMHNTLTVLLLLSAL